MTSEITDRDGQPLNHDFNRKRNRNKAAAMLYGILSGITADKNLNDTELLFLRSWLDLQEEMKGDVLDIYDAVQSIIEDGQITDEERNDLFSLLNDCIEYSGRIYEDDARINELIGYLKGISADGVVNELEFEQLRKKVAESIDLVDLYPYNIIKKRIDVILSDGKITKDELNELHDYICDITGTNFTRDGDVIGGATTLFNDEIPYDIKGKYICFTGKFLSGKRNEIEREANERGLISQNSVTNQTSIVVIGTLSSRDWIHETSGRKIEKAIELKNSGKNLIVTCERIWLEKIKNGV